MAPDAKSLIMNKLDARNGRDLWLLDIATKQTKALLTGPANEFDGRFSPDGKWLAYASDESGRPELYVEDFPDVRTRARVSTAGIVSFGSGTPSLTLIHWAADGSELIYLDADRRTLVSVAVSSGPPLQIGAARALCELPAESSYADVSKDGQTILAVVPDEGQVPCSIAVTLNWIAGLEAK
jgi:Tol biopolymer transport system component